MERDLLVSEHVPSAASRVPGTVVEEWVVFLAAVLAFTPLRGPGARVTEPGEVDHSLREVSWAHEFVRLQHAALDESLLLVLALYLRFVTKKHVFDAISMEVPNPIPEPVVVEQSLRADIFQQRVENGISTRAPEYYVLLLEVVVFDFVKTLNILPIAEVRIFGHPKLQRLDWLLVLVSR